MISVAPTNKMFEELAVAYDSEEWPGKPTGEVVIDRLRITDEDLNEHLIISIITV